MGGKAAIVGKKNRTIVTDDIVDQKILFSRPKRFSIQVWLF